MTGNTDTSVSCDTPKATLPEATMRQLLGTGVVRDVVARGVAGGFVVEACLAGQGGGAVILGSTRSGARLFASVTTIALLLRRLGVDRFTVDASNFTPGRVRAARPDRAGVMRAANEGHRLARQGKNDSSAPE